MPSSPRSLRVTDLYRERLLGIRGRAVRDARAVWGQVSLDDLDGTYQLEPLVVRLELAQTENVRATRGYLGAFLSTELGRRTAAQDFEAPVGLSRDERPLIEAFLSPLIAVKTEIGEGIDPREALRHGEAKLVRSAGVNVDHAARLALVRGMEADERITGWRRAVRGTCGACLGAATDESRAPGELIDTHPGCQCVSEPEVAELPQTARRPTGTQIFAAMDAAQQDEVLGPEKAELVRAGDAQLSDLVDTSRLEREPDFITEAPLAALQ